MSISNSRPQTILKALRISIYDGVFAQSFAVLTGSIFLPAFALVLGASPFQIGLLASIVFFATLSQLPGAYLIEKHQQRKQLVLFSASTARVLWIPIILSSFWLADSKPALVLNLLTLLIISYHVFAHISGVSWLSWMSTLVPDEIRGRYFGLRNSALSLFTLLSTILGGYYLDWFKEEFPDLPMTRSFEILFGLAIVLGGISILFLLKQPEPAVETKSGNHLRERLKAPLKDSNFRKLLRFAVFWSFGVNFASPFFLVYMLQDLQLSYTLVSIYTVSSAMADLLGMWAWGHFSDQLGNRAVIIINSFIATILPFIWIFTDASLYAIFLFIPLLHFIGGFSWAGYNLCSVNLVLRMAPKEGNSVYFAAWNTVNGISAGLGAVSGGLFSSLLHHFHHILPFNFQSDLKYIFLLSALLRLISLLGVRQIQEYPGSSVRRAIRVLRSIRSWTTMMGYHPALHFFIASDRLKDEKSPYWPIWQRKSRSSINSLPDSIKK
jgi:MFS family permease